ncbi:hypothetical protein OsccyDRAFT_4485 [Leptolyngbyaceae cyanobacterium JSC-12]|nr:hypothetical protein OsccyDRAFT_4485 [Leptolyngbyaceae cyanobacterium JSC-12]
MRPLYISFISLVVIIAPMTTAIAQQRTTYPRDVVEQYISSCSGRQAGQIRAVCRCIISGIQGQYTYQQFQRLNEEIARTGKVQDARLNRIIQDCKSNSNTYSLRSSRVSSFKS